MILFMKSIAQFNPKLVFVIVLLLVSVSFLIGLYWHTIILRISTINPSHLRCLGLNNLSETYQVDCYFPVTSQTQNFEFKQKLDCNILTNSQFNNGGEEFSLHKNMPNPEYDNYNNITLIKSDYRNFSLDFSQPNQITQSSEPGEPHKEPYSINSESENIVHAERIFTPNDFFGETYEYITVSKTSGKGMKTWVNTDRDDLENDSMVIDFFQCE